MKKTLADLLPGERALVRIVKPEKRYAFGRVEKLLEKSPSRAEPFCPIYKRCGGCVCQHMTYEASLAFKRQQVQDLLQRVGGLSIEVPPVWGMAHPFGYRNKGAYPVAQTDGAPACGFFAPRSHDLVPLPENGCAIQGEDSAKATQAVLNWMRENSVPAYDEQTGRGLVRHIMTRSTTSGELMVVVVVTRADIPKASRLIELLRAAVPGLCSVCLSVNSRRTNVILGTDIRVLWGKAAMEDTLCGLRFSVSPLSFFQVNPQQTERLYGLALEYAGLTGAETVVDAYCGAGTISLLLAQKAKKVIGIEIVPEAIQNANENAARNGIANAEFHVGATEELLPKLVENGLRPDVIVLDPPRKGCDPAVLQAIIAAAEELRAPVIVQTTPGTLKYASPAMFHAMVAAAASEASVPVVMHLDHGSSYELAMQAFRAGYTSVMIDGSHHVFEENIEITQSVVRACHAAGIPVEAELGKVGGKEDDLDGGNGNGYTVPSEAAEFAERTGVDSLAVAIGTAHGVYKGTPKLDMERLSEIRKVVSVPLVLHGTSGVPDDAVRECVARGMCKVNYATDLRIAFSKGLKEYLAKDPEVFDPKKYSAVGREYVKEYVKSKILVCGSNGKA